MCRRAGNEDSWRRYQTRALPGFMLDEMREEFMAETFLDIGSASIGKKFDKIEDIQCPHCKVGMDKVVDPTRHIYGWSAVRVVIEFFWMPESLAI